MHHPIHHGNVLKGLQVGAVQYRIHKSVVIDQSSSLTAKLPGLRRTCGHIACLSPEVKMNTISIDEVTSEEFDVLLGILYPQSAVT